MGAHGEHPSGQLVQLPINVGGTPHPPLLNAAPLGRLLAPLPLRAVAHPSLLEQVVDHGADAVLDDLLQGQRSEAWWSGHHGPLRGFGRVHVGSTLLNICVIMWNL